MEDDDQRWYNSDIGFGICVFLCCAGLGTCSMLENSKIEIRQDPPVEQTLDKIIKDNEQ